MRENQAKEKYSDFLNLLDLPKNCQVDDLDEFIKVLVKSKADKRLALLELDHTVGRLSNFVLLISMHLKQNYLLAAIQEKKEADDSFNYTKQEVARRFKVNRRTVTNWIHAGLKTTEIGGVCRINENDIQDFIKNHRTKKFAWPSLGTVPYKKAS